MNSIKIRAKAHNKQNLDPEVFPDISPDRPLNNEERRLFDLPTAYSYQIGCSEAERKAAEKTCAPITLREAVAKLRAEYEAKINFLLE